jgi:hypothetical protein
MSPHPLALALVAAALPVVAFPVAAFSLDVALPAGTVVAGVSQSDSARTEVTAFFPDGTSRVLASEGHKRGFLPKGSLDASPAPSRIVLAVPEEGGDGATIVVLDLATGARMQVGTRAIASQRPLLVDGRVTWVRASETEKRSTFDVVEAPLAGGGEEVLASVEGAWLSPIAASPGHYLLIDVNGGNRVVARDGATFVDVRDLGTDRVRSPALVAAPGERNHVWLERGEPQGRALLLAIDARGGTTVMRAGLAGMDPLAVGGLIVAGAGEKHASLVVLDGTRSGPRLHTSPLPGVPPDRFVDRAIDRIVDLGRPGIATPRAGALVDDALVVAAWLDRGASLPGELVVVDARGTRVLVNDALAEVYGVMPTTASTSVSTTSPTSAASQPSDTSPSSGAPLPSDGTSAPGAPR